MTFYGSSLLDSGATAIGQPLEIPGASQPGLVSKAGLMLFGNDGKAVGRLMLHKHHLKIIIILLPLPGILDCF